MPQRWYDLNPEETARQTATDPRTGLSSTEARSRLETNGTNTVFPIPADSFWEYMRKTSTNTLSILLGLSCLLAAIFGQPIMALILVSTLAVNYITVIISYIKSQKILAKMGHSALPTAKVIRDGKMTLIRQDQIVVGDVICLSAGDIVPCDARLIEDNNLITLETGITGANGPVRKDSGYQNIRNILPHEAINMVYASTIVQSGHGKAIACRCGKDCYVCSVGKNVSAISYDRLKVFNSLRRLSFFVTLFAIILTFGLTVLNMLPAFHQYSALDGLLYALAFGCGAMTEFYAVFGYIIVSVGIFGALTQSGQISTGALIKKAEKLEAMQKLSALIIPAEAVTAAQDTTLCSIYLDVKQDEPYEIDALGFHPDCENILRLAVVSTGLYGDRLVALTSAGDNMYSCEEDAILRAAKQSGLYTRELHEEFPLVEHLSKSEYCPFETTLVFNRGERRIVARGGADEILAVCSFYRDLKGNIHHLDPAARGRLSAIAARMMRERGPVIGVATNYSKYYKLVRLSDTLSGMTFEGFLGFDEPLLPGVIETVERMQNAGIRVILSSPDTSEREISLAGKLKILVSPDIQVADRTEIDAMSDSTLAARSEEITLYRGMNKNSIRRVIKTLKKQGETVGFLGLNFDEIVAMREADVSYTQSVTLSGRRRRSANRNALPDVPISVSKAGDGAPSGCDALRFVSDVIVSVVSGRHKSGGLNAVCRSIQRAKMIYRNIERLLTYLLTVNTARLLLLLWTFFSGRCMLTPVQMLVCGLIFDLAAVMIIAFEAPSSDILETRSKSRLQPPAAVNISAVLTGVFFGICQIIVGSLLYTTSAVSLEGICTPIFLSTLIASPVILLESGKEGSLFKGKNRISNILLLSVLFGIILVCLGMAFPAFGALFGIYRIGWKSRIGILVLTALLLTFIELFKIPNALQTIRQKAKERLKKPQNPSDEGNG